jgi:beta-galactosidase
LATYQKDFYTGRPALTLNAYGKGRAYYIASRNDDRFLSDFYGSLCEPLDLMRALDINLPMGITAQLRTDGEQRFVFLMNFKPEIIDVDLGRATFTDKLTDAKVSGILSMEPYGVMVLVER